MFLEDFEVGSKIYFFENSIFFERNNEFFFVISDLHLGFAFNYSSLGLDFLLKNYKELFDKIVFVKNLFESNFNVKVKNVIFNGDIIDDFGLKNIKNRLNVKKFFSLIKNKFSKVFFVKGNHDVMLSTFSLEEYENFFLKDFFVFDDVFVYHGDKNFYDKIKNDDNIKYVIVGHEHSVFLLDDNIRSEKFKCLFKTTFFDKTVFVMPSFNPDILGSNVNNFEFMNVILKEVFEGEIFIYNEFDNKLLYFGSIKKE